ncbi:MULTISPECIES: NADAR family protein [unclassified Myroides]|uniref:NADAR family protein n=1 Tax=unclassified Myroides TaxID=2642485 RepID=UPI003D2F9B0C
MEKYDQDSFHFFYRQEDFMSQWYLKSFCIEEITFNCVEQFIMYKKAMLFGDNTIANKILKEQHPGNQKRLGRLVKNFRSNIWEKSRFEISYEGNYAKFNQNQDLCSLLLETRDKIIAEASPTDLIWGIGYGMENENKYCIYKWRGKNLLGKVLMQVREDLKNSVNIKNSKV